MNPEHLDHIKALVRAAVVAVNALPDRPRKIEAGPCNFDCCILCWQPEWGLRTKANVAAVQAAIEEAGAQSKFTPRSPYYSSKCGSFELVFATKWIDYMRQTEEAEAAYGAIRAIDPGAATIYYQMD